MLINAVMKNEVLYADEKRSYELGQSVGVQFPKKLAELASTRSIRDFAPDVNTSEKFSLNTGILETQNQRDTESAINYLAGQLVDNGPRATEIAKALASMNQSKTTGRETQGIRRDMGIFRKDRSTTQQGQREDVQNPIQIMRELTDSIQVGYNPGGQMSANGARVL